jgi:hypothetical protein
MLTVLTMAGVVVVGAAVEVRMAVGVSVAVAVGVSGVVAVGVGGAKVAVGVGEDVRVGVVVDVRVGVAVSTGSVTIGAKGVITSCAGSGSLRVNASGRPPVASSASSRVTVESTVVVSVCVKAS